MDGVICASVGTISDLFNKIVAIDAADIEHSTMMAMVFGRKPREEAEEEDTSEEADADSGLGRFMGLFRRIKSKVSEQREGLAVSEEAWARVGAAVEGRPRGEGPAWVVLGDRLLQLAVREQDTVTTVLHSGSEAVARLTEEMRLHPAMYGDHMPWGYQATMEAAATSDTPADIACLDTL
jgi:hypothetical protein